MDSVPKRTSFHNGILSASVHISTEGKLNRTTFFICRTRVIMFFIIIQKILNYQLTFLEFSRKKQTSISMRETNWLMMVQGAGGGGQGG